MDLLNELFRDAGLARRLLDTRHVTADRGLRFPCERSVGFHIVLEGTMYVHADGRTRRCSSDPATLPRSPRPAGSFFEGVQARSGRVTR